jgi:hypothetical protein
MTRAAQKASGYHGAHGAWLREEWQDDYRLVWAALLAAAPPSPERVAVTPLTEAQIEQLTEEWYADDDTDGQDLVRVAIAKFCEVNGIGVSTGSGEGG